MAEVYEVKWVRRAGDAVKGRRYGSYEDAKQAYRDLLGASVRAVAVFEPWQGGTVIGLSHGWDETSPDKVEHVYKMTYSYPRALVESETFEASYARAQERLEEKRREHGAEYVDMEMMR